MTLFNKHETAKYLRISIPTLDRHIASGLLIPVRVGGRVFFREESLERFLNDSEAKGRQLAQARAKAAV